MKSLMLLDWLGDCVAQVVAQCQFWCMLGGLVILVIVLVGAGVVLFQLIETLDGNPVGPGIPH